MRLAVLALAVLFAAPLRAEEPKLPELKLTYAVTWKGLGLGSATVVLKPKGEADCYRYESLTEPIGLVRMFYGKPHETSDFCVSGGRVVPRRFEFTNPKDDGASFTLEFDAKAGKVRDGKGKERDIPANAQDRFGLQQAVRLWVLEHLKSEPRAEKAEFASVDDTRVRPYTFAITGREKVETPAGTFETILVQRIDNPNRTSKFWLAPEREYMPVKVEQFRNGSSELRMVLR
jgi:hypothetical protein